MLFWNIKSGFSQCLSCGKLNGATASSLRLGTHFMLSPLIVCLGGRVYDVEIKYFAWNATLTTGARRGRGGPRWRGRSVSGVTEEKAAHDKTQRQKLVSDAPFGMFLFSFSFLFLFSLSLKLCNISEMPFFLSSRCWVIKMQSKVQQFEPNYNGNIKVKVGGKSANEMGQ